VHPARQQCVRPLSFCRDLRHRHYFTNPTQLVGILRVYKSALLLAEEGIVLNLSVSSLLYSPRVPLVLSLSRHPRPRLCGIAVHIVPLTRSLPIIP
jgi:hypothetical protein